MVEASAFMPPPGPAMPGVLEARPGARWLALAADALATPLLVLQADALLVHANAAALAELERADVLALTPQGRVVAARAEATGLFKAALAACAAGHTRLVPGLARGIHAAVAPLATAWAAASVPGAPAIPLLLLSLPARGLRDLRPYAELHGLSVAETRVLERLALGDTTAEVSYALGVKPATVRSQILSMRRKTGHADVRALLRDLAMTPPMVRTAAATTR